jgi:small subunit ribosomal protein S3
MARLRKASVSNIIIERTLKLVTVTVKSARPGVIIGKGGQEVDKLREELKKLTGKEVQINIFEIKRPELDAKLVAESVARQIEARISAIVAPSRWPLQARCVSVRKASRSTSPAV